MDIGDFREDVLNEMRSEGRRPELSVADLVQVAAATRRAGALMTGMVTSFAEIESRLRAVADQIAQQLPELRMSADAMRWTPDTQADIPVHWCSGMADEAEHPGHTWEWQSGPAYGGPPVRSQCPGWPLPSITDAAPQCETGDDRTCTLSCPLHG